MKALLTTMIAVALVGGLVGGGLFAYFSDTETASGTYTNNKISLAVDDGTGFEEHWTTDPVELDLKPCQWVIWEKDILKNTGDRIGKIDVDMTITGWSGGDYPEPEANLQDPDICDIEDGMEIMVFNDDDDAIITMIGDADNVGEAFDNLQAAGYDMTKLLFSGKLADFAVGPADLGSLEADPLGAGNGEELKIMFVVHLGNHPVDDNLMQGDKVTVDKSYRLRQYLCDEDEGGEGGKLQVLPECFVEAKGHYPGDATAAQAALGEAFKSYWEVYFTNIPAGDYDVENNKLYAAWCIDHRHTMGYNWTYNVKLMSSLDPDIYSLVINWGYDGIPVPEVFNYVNYLINTYDASNSGESDLQRAIWYFINGWDYAKVSTYPGAKAMVDDALLNGASFVPGEGQIAAVVMFRESPNKMQVSILEVDP